MYPAVVAILFTGKNSELELLASLLAHWTVCLEPIPGLYVNVSDATILVVNFMFALLGVACR